VSDRPINMKAKKYCRKVHELKVSVITSLLTERNLEDKNNLASRQTYSLYVCHSEYLVCWFMDSLIRCLKMLIRSVEGMAMVRNNLAARTKRFVCSGNSHCARKYFSSIKTFNDIPSIQGEWPLIGHAHLFGPTGMYLQVQNASLIS